MITDIRKKLTTVEPWADFEKVRDTELGYFRCDHDGYRWWCTYWPGKTELKDEAVAQEMNEVRDTLIRAFPNLDALSDYCHKSAQQVDPTEFNAFLVTERVRCWIRMITRPGDYNMYIRFYPKEEKEGG